MTERLVFDHVILGVQDLGAAAQRLWDAHGLKAVGGGVHPGGTMNQAAGFADQSYLELLAVDDASLEAGAWLERLLRSGDRLVGWAVRTDDIEAVAQRVGEQITPGSIDMPDGTRGSWRTAGTARLARDRWLPFFIQYDMSPESEGRVREVRSQAVSAHRVKPHGIAWVEISGDQPALSDWLGGADLDVRFGDGEPGLRAVGISTDQDEIVIR